MYAGKQTRPLLIRNARVIDGTGAKPLDNASIAISDGVIQELTVSSLNAGNDWQIIDARGKIVIPGLIDMHAHLISGGFDTISDVGITFDIALERRMLKQMLYWGITAVYSPVQPLAIGTALRRETASGEFLLPELFISGPGFAASGGWAGANDPDARREPTNAQEAARAMDELAEAKVDIIKIFYDDMSCAFTHSMTKMARPVMEAVVKAAHERGLKVMVHAYDNENHKETMRAGADIMAHSAVTAPVDDEYIKVARENHAMYLGTLSIYYDTFDQLSIRELIRSEHVTRSVPQATLSTLAEGGPLDQFEGMIRQTYIKQQLPVIAENMRKVWQAGISLGVGPDTGVMGAFPGFAVHREMELMAQSGVAPMAVLQAATANGAACLGRSQIGTIARGKIADLVVLRSNPLEDIRNTRDISDVIRGGVVVDREQLRTDVFEIDTAPARQTAHCC